MDNTKQFQTHLPEGDGQAVLSVVSDRNVVVATNQELIAALRSNETTMVLGNSAPVAALVAEAAKRLEEFQTAVNLPDPKTAIKTRAVREKRKSRADRYSDAQGSISDAKTEAEELRDELQNWLDGLPENLQNGSKADALNEAISNLDTFIQSAEEAEGTDVEFPGMFG
jgi:hypothetical protein